MKNIIYLLLAFTVIAGLGSCRESSVEPVSNNKMLLTRVAWQLVQGGDLVGGISKFNQDGTFYIEDDHESGTWEFQDKAETKLVLHGRNQTETAEIITLTENSLVIQHRGGTASFVPENNFSTRKLLLTWHKWKSISPDTGVKILFHRDGHLEIENGDEDGIGTWELGSNESIINFTASLSSFPNEILELTESRLVLHETMGSNPRTYVFVPDDNSADPVFTIWGKLKIEQGSLTNDTRILAVWSTDDNQNAYVFGEGAIDWNSNSFILSLKSEPPAEALNSDGTRAFGIAYIVMVSNPTIVNNRISDTEIENKFMGAVSDRAIIYSSGDWQSSGGLTWMKDFPSGLSFAKGVYNTGGKDAFELVSKDNIELRMNPNWFLFAFPNWN